MRDIDREQDESFEQIPRLDPDLETVARVELGETPEVRTKCLTQLRELVEKEADNGLRSRTDTPFLLR